ncbi:hypothetical protein LIER_14720 [Lithospermum erythrorhizon]|uniref:Uncharacterized protein n=1 Tax=Lithospermum erythrorhizon TaxID=34254 RepID=A0AAV3Q4A6_LITER
MSTYEKSNKSSKKLKLYTIDEYTPTENTEINSSEDENEILPADKVKLRTCSKKVSNTSAIAMSDLVKIRNSNNKKGHLVKEPQAKVVLHSKQQQDAVSQVELSKSNPKRKLAPQNQQEQEVVSPPKEQQREVAIAPGSMSAYLKIKEKLRQEELRGKQSEALIQKLSLQNLEVQTSKYKRSLGHELEEEHENSMGLSDYDLEPERDEDAEHDGVHFGNDNQLEVQTDPLIEQDREDNLVADPSKPKQKRTRGPTVCKDVLEWTLDDRKLIILNEMGRLLVLIRRLQINLLDKDKIWNYVKTKYIIAEEGKNYVLSRVGILWRKYKYSVKAHHYSAFDNDVDRLNHAPDIIPEKHFMDLIEYWNLDVVQVESKKKAESSAMQMDRHTMGPMSFARKKYEMGY